DGLSLRRSDLLLFGLGIPLVVILVALADRKRLFAVDAFPTPFRKRVALALLALVLCATVLLPAAAGATAVDTKSLRFVQVFSGQALLAAFLLAWWLLAGRPRLADFLALRSQRPLLDAGTGVCLGLIGWTLTVVVGLAFAFALALFG